MQRVPGICKLCLFSIFFVVAVSVWPGELGNLDWPRAAAADCLPAPEGLVSWWRAEGNPLDAWGSNDGVAPYNARYEPGKVGQALSNSFVLVPDAASLHFTNGLTIQAWVNPLALPPSPFANPLRTIVGKWDYPTFQSPAQSSFFLGMSNNSQLYFAVTPNGSPSTNTTVRTADRLPTNQWSLVTATYDGAALRLYLNGNLAGQTNYAAAIFAGTDNLGIGGNPVQQGLDRVWPFSGSIDEVCLYNRALSESEIQAVFEADVTGLCLAPPTLLAQPQSQTIPLGEDVLFSVSTLGTRPLRYHWFFNGRPLAGATNASLILEKVQTNKVGNYSVLVSNILGKALSSDATLALSPAPTCVQPPAGLISWWPADHSGIDAVGTNNVTVFSQLPSFALGKVGFAFSNSAAYPGIIEAANSPSLNFSSNADFSIEAWIKAAQVPLSSVTPFPFLPAPIMTIVQKAAGSPTVLPAARVPGYSLFLSEGRLGWWFGAGPGGLHSASFISGGPDLRDSLFHHVALSLQRNATNGGKLYVDGRLALMFDPTAERGDLSNPSPLLIGSGGSSDLGRTTFNGLIDELAIYNRALTEGEILAIRQAGAAGKCKVPPFIIAQPANQTVLRGGTATFSVGAGGTPPLHYQWAFKSLQIPGATHPSLAVTNVQAVNIGSYSVYINNKFGETFSSNALLKLDRPPVANCAGVIVPADSHCLAQASIDAGSYHPDGYVVMLVQSPPGPYPLGTNLVTLTAIDPYGASNSCSARVVVLDATPPAILCADILVTNAHGAWTSVVTYNPAVIDNCPGAGQVICDPPSGSVFGLGSHTVICSVADAVGNSNQCTFKVMVYPGNVPPVPVIEVSPSASFPGDTNLIVIAPDGQSAGVTFDGSNSYDLDDPTFHYFWYEGTNLFSTNVVAARTLSVGSHAIHLLVDDTFPLGTNSTAVTVEVISPAQAAGIVMDLLDNSGLGRQDTQPLIATLKAAVAAFERSNARAALNQLAAFQNKVRAQVAPSEPDLADDLTRSAQIIIDSARTR